MYLTLPVHDSQVYEETMWHSLNLIDISGIQIEFSDSGRVPEIRWTGMIFHYLAWESKHLNQVEFEIIKLKFIYKLIQVISN